MTQRSDGRVPRGAHLFLSGAAASFTLALTLSATSYGLCGVRTELAYWAPDRGTPYHQWFEGAKELQSFFTKDYRAAGNLYAYVRNLGTRPISATSFRLNGRDLNELRKENAVVWWRVLPAPIPVGGMGEILVRFRAPLETEAALGVTFDDGSIAAARAAPSPCPLRIETVGFTKKMDRVFLVVEKLTEAKQTLNRVLVDGVDVTRQSRSLDPSFSTGVAPVMIRFHRSLAHGSYHVLRRRDD